MQSKKFSRQLAALERREKRARQQIERAEKELLTLKVRRIEIAQKEPILCPHCGASSPLGEWTFVQLHNLIEGSEYSSPFKIRKGLAECDILCNNCSKRVAICGHSTARSLLREGNINFPKECFSSIVEG